MSRALRAPTPDTPPPADGLERLVEMEARLAAQQRAAAAEAEQILAEARAVVGALGTGEEEDFARQAEVLAVRVAREGDVAILDVRQAAEARVGRLAATSAERIEELAGWAVDQVLGSSEGGAAP
jgi:hypothetical protein